MKKRSILTGGVLRHLVFIDVNMKLTETSIFLRCLILDDDAMTLGGWLTRITSMKMSS